MKKILLNMVLLASIATSQAQNVGVSGFTKLDVNILASTKQGTVIPTSDGGYFWSRGLKLSKYNSSNTEDWSTTLTGTSFIGYSHQITSICDDGQGGAIITGKVNGTLSFGNDSITPFYTASGLYTSDAFIARVNSTGKIWWHRLGEYEGSAPGTDQGIDVKVVGNKVYWLAHVTGRNFKFGSTNYPLSEYGNNVSILAEFDMDGTNNWVVATKGGGCVPSYLIAQSNQVAFAAYSLGSSTAINFGNSKTLSYNQASFFIVKFNTSGLAQWAVTYDDDNSAANLYGFTADDDGDFYACGMASNFTSSYGIKKGQGYLVKINGTDGTAAWSRVLSKVTGSANVLHGPLLGVQFVNGKVYVCGNTNGNLYLQSSATDSVEVKKSSNLLPSEQFVAQYEKTGTLASLVKANGGTAGGTMEHMVQSNNNLIGVGVFSTNIEFGSHTMPATGANVGAYFLGFYSINTGSSSTGLISNVNQNQSLSVYPNPTSNVIIINQMFSKPFEAVLYNIEGKVVLKETLLPNNLNQLDLKDIIPGVYYLKAKDNNEVFTQKVIKQ
ncbi:MAG: T9SS type A sorting domain-containing protein [Bacteroidia bacterium]|nr:T9SS type A sorting domain-containing protein [Bacteroidia bacterium]